MSKRVLLLSDNSYLIGKCIQILDNLGILEKCDIATTTKLDIEEISNVEKVNLKLDSTIESLINRYRIIISVHCKSLFPNKLVNHIQCFNLHPGYNPLNRGWFPQVFSIIKNIDIGATLHEIDFELDHGKIIDRRKLKKTIYDTSYSLYNRIVELELEIFKDNILSILDLAYKSVLPENEGNLFLKKDFDDLCRIDLEEQSSFIDFYNKLRALSFNGYKNAYFIDPEDGKKVYLSINIEKEK